MAPNVLRSWTHSAKSGEMNRRLGRTAGVDDDRGSVSGVPRSPNGGESGNRRGRGKSLGNPDRFLTRSQWELNWCGRPEDQDD